MKSDTEDARRYRFIRDHKAQAHSLKMNGAHAWRFRMGWPTLIGSTLDEAIDSAIEEVEANKRIQEVLGDE